MGFNVISILINIKLRPCFPMYILVKTGNNLSKSREPPCCFFLSAAVPALGSAHCQYLVSILHTYRILLSDSLPNPSFSSPQQQLLTAQRNRGSQNQSSESPWDDFRDAQGKARQDQFSFSNSSFKHIHIQAKCSQAAFRLCAAHAMSPSQTACAREQVTVQTPLTHLPSFCFQEKEGQKQRNGSQRS